MNYLGEYHYTQVKVDFFYKAFMLITASSVRRDFSKPSYSFLLNLLKSLVPFDFHMIICITTD